MSREIAQTRTKRLKPDGDDHPIAPFTSGADVPMVLFKQVSRVWSTLLGKGDGGALVSLLYTAELL
jgi:hypothetical protein